MREVIRLIERDGWYLVATRGSHRQYKHPVKFAIVIEKAEANYSAYVPDLPGCIATGETIEALENEIREAIRFHIEGLRADGLPVTAADQHRGLRGDVGRSRTLAGTHFLTHPGMFQRGMREA